MAEQFNFRQWAFKDRDKEAIPIKHDGLMQDLDRLAIIGNDLLALQKIDALGSLSEFLKQNLKTSITPTTAFYDGGVHTKSSLNIEADPSDNTKSKWIKVPNNGSHLIYPVQGKLMLVNMRKCYAYEPGHYESPPYSNDTSMSKMQFIYANNSANSDEINAALASDSINLFLYGAWSERVTTITTCAVLIAGKHPYSRLWVRRQRR